MRKTEINWPLIGGILTSITIVAAIAGTIYFLAFQGETINSAKLREDFTKAEGQQELRQPTAEECNAVGGVLDPEGACMNDVMKLPITESKATVPTIEHPTLDVPPTIMLEALPVAKCHNKDGSIVGFRQYVLNVTHRSPDRWTHDYAESYEGSLNTMFEITADFENCIHQPAVNPTKEVTNDKSRTLQSKAPHRPRVKRRKASPKTDCQAAPRNADSERETGETGLPSGN